MLREGVARAVPRLDVAAGVLGASEVERLETEECDRLGLCFRERLREIRPVVAPLGSVVEEDVAELVEEGLGRERGDRAYRDGAPVGEALDVAVGQVERDTLDREGLEGTRLVPRRDFDGVREGLSVGLGQDEPPRFPDEDRLQPRSVAFGHGPAVPLVVLHPDAHRHAQDDGLLAGPHAPLELVPPLEGGDRPGGEASFAALEHGRELVTEAVSVEEAVRLEDLAGAGDRVSEELRPANRDGWRHQGPPCVSGPGRPRARDGVSSGARRRGGGPVQCLR